MAASIQKPLPAIPQVPGTSPLAVLSDESKAHLSKFIRHILAQDDKPFASQSSQDTWARVIETVLDQLGQNILNENWLAGLKLERRWIRSLKGRTKEPQEVEVDQKSLASSSREKRLENSADDRHSEHAPSAAFQHKQSSPNVAAIDHAVALDQLRLCLSRQSSSSKPSDSVNHLLLCVASFESQSISEKDDSEHQRVLGCVFKPKEFALPDVGQDVNGGGGIVLFGLDEWDGDAFMSGERAINMVGGTFYFKGIDSIADYDMLFKLLRLSVYFHHSLLLEQHFLANSSVEIHFTETKSLLPITQTSLSHPPITEPPSSRNIRIRKRRSSVTSSILTLISKTGTLVSRAASIRPVKRRSLAHVAGEVSEKPVGQVAGRLTSPRSASSIPDQKKGNTEALFGSTLEQVEHSAEFLSTSIGISFKPPFLLARLAEKEKNESHFYLKGDEKAGLHSLLGWNNKNARRKGMSGTPGFVRHQTFPVLHSQHIPPMQTPLPTPASETPSSSVHTSTVLQQSVATVSKCSLPRWITFRHYSRTADKSLGEAIVEFCYSAEHPCETLRCQSKMGQHEQRYIHDGLMITVKVSTCEIGEAEDEDELGLWLSCGICGSKTKRADMSDGTYLFSFSKYLETMVYSPAVCVIRPSLCEHTTASSPTGVDSPLPSSRLNIIRHFSYSSWVVSFSLSTIEDSFELRVPRLQIVRETRNKPSEILPITESRSPIASIEEKKILRKEILSWWQSMAEQIDKLESSFTSEDLRFGKSLPRLPSIYDDFEVQEVPSLVLLAHPQPSSPQPPAAAANASATLPDQKPVEYVTATTSNIPQIPQKEIDPVQLLSNLRHTFHNTERALYAQLGRTQVCSLNDVRWSFRSAARVAIKRLSAWENKHLPGKAKSQITSERIVITEPDWWENGCHAVPGGNVIVREGDWGSIIAYTLSSEDFRNELTKMFAVSPKSSTDPAPPVNSNSSSAMTSNSYKLFNFNSQPDPDPDQDDLWRETEHFSASITRKRHPRDPSSLLSLRDVLRHRSPANGSTGHSSSLLSNLVDGSPETPPSAWAKAAIGINKEAADGEVVTLSETESMNRILHDVEAALSDSPPESSVPKDAETHLSRQESTSVVSGESNGTIHAGDNTPRPPTPPGKDSHSASEKRASNQQAPTAQSSAASSSFTTSLTNGLTNAMRFVLNTGDSNPPQLDPHVVHHHALLSLDTRIDDHPHINYEWTIGKRLKFSCTVYYAKQFDTLRNRCGLDDAFVKSLSHSSNWTAEGGKSKSNFWKTRDNRFIIKTLVNAWNVADLRVLVDLAPSYFQYLDSTAGKPTVLAKLLGFYTIEIKNLETGTVQSKADLLVMENLFYEQNVVKTFDLKGISGRKVKAKSDVRDPQKLKTMFDGEWIEGQQRAMILVRPHSKVVLQEALKSDSEFLAKSNIMDYSLLLGVDEEHRQIACGLVDTIGSYTFAKTLEYKAKQGLQSGKDVTVVPPAEYRERFVTALDKYFLACPDKWSRPLDGSNVNSDPMQLPSVL